MIDAQCEQPAVLGVRVTNVSMDAALRLLETLSSEWQGRARSVFFVNANTLNLACRDPEYRRILLSGDHVFGDGTGVRWAALVLQGLRLAGNVNGTDLVPRFLRLAPGGPRRYYLLGASPAAIERASQHARRAFPSWTLVGHHHGYVELDEGAALVHEINAARPALLLVGMGNPKQECWIHRHQGRLEVPLCIGVGGLFDYWAGDLSRAPAWLRRGGFEWLHLMLHQPRKIPRYLLGSPEFLMRVARSRWIDGPPETDRERRR